jgi:hypothetical protein
MPGVTYDGMEGANWEDAGLVIVISDCERHLLHIERGIRVDCLTTHRLREDLNISKFCIEPS